MMSLPFLLFACGLGAAWLRQRGAAMGFWVAGLVVLLVLFRVHIDRRSEHRALIRGITVPSDLSRLLNALGLIAVDTVLVLAFIDQLWFRDLPCPICILQRAGFVAAGFGLALNLLFGPRPSHYGVTILGAAVGAAIVHAPDPAPHRPGQRLIRQCDLWHASLYLGVHRLCADDHRLRHSPARRPAIRALRAVVEAPDVLPLTALVTFFVLAVGNVFSTLLICGAGFCPEAPTGYLIFSQLG